MDLFTNNGVFGTEYSVPSSSILDPGASTSVFTAGAICFQNDSLEPYSSQGPTIDGRIKPDIAGQDAVTSGVYGAVLDLRQLRLHRHLRRLAAHRGRGRAGQGGEPELHRVAAAQLPPRPCRRARHRGPGQPVRGGQAAARRGAGRSRRRPLTTGAASGVTSRGRDAGRHRQPAGRADELPLPVRHDRRLRQPDRRRPRRRGHLGPGRLRRVSGPHPSTTYHYRIVASNELGTTQRQRRHLHHAGGPGDLTPPPPGPSGQQGVLGATGAGGSTGGPAPARPAATKPLVTCKIKGKKVTCTVKLAKAKRATVKLTRGGKVCRPRRRPTRARRPPDGAHAAAPGARALQAERRGHRPQRQGAPPELLHHALAHGRPAAPRPPVSGRRGLPRAGEAEHAHAHRRARDLRGRAARARRVPRPHRVAPAPRPPLPPEARGPAARDRPAAVGRRPDASTSPTTSATPPCPSPATRRRCWRWPGACSPSAWIARSRCGSCGSSRACSDGGFALLSKTHHALVDGVSGVDLASVLFDLSPEGSDATAASRGCPSPSRRAPSSPRAG